MNSPLEQLTSEWLRTGVPLFALAVSAMSVWFTRNLWLQTNRPIVTAAIRTHKGGNTAITYELALVNSGARPATVVRLTAGTEHVEGALESGVSARPDLAAVVTQVLRCFSGDAVIPVLLNGQTLTNSFGFTGSAGGVGPFWRIGATIPVVIDYSDLEGRSYRTAVTLVIRDTAGFAGGYWAESNDG